MRPSSLLLALVGLLGCGCASLQDYEVLPADRAGDMMARRRVFDAAVTKGEHVHTEYGGALPTRHNLTLSIGKVIKGGEVPAMLELKRLRAPTDAEKSLLPTPRNMPFYATRFRVAYDDHRGDKYTHLQLLPLGLTPEGEAWMAQSGVHPDSAKR